MAAAYKYFLYSAQQHKERRTVEKNIGKTFIAGKVLVKGQWQDYTEISSNPKNQYSDCKVIAEGDLTDIKYRKSKSVWGGN